MPTSYTTSWGTTTTIPVVGAITAATIKALIGSRGVQVGSPLRRLAGIDAAVSFKRRQRAAETNIEDGKFGIPRSPRRRATVVLRVARNDARTRPWLKALLARRPFKVAAVAQANKTAWIIWALLNKGGTYRRPDPLAITVVDV